MNNKQKSNIKNYKTINLPLYFRNLLKNKSKF